MDKREPYLVLLLIASITFFALGIYVYEYNWFAELNLESQWFEERARKYGLLDTYLFKSQIVYRLFTIMLLAFGMFMMKTKKKLTENEELKKHYIIITGAVLTVHLCLSYLTIIIPTNASFFVSIVGSFLCYIFLIRCFAMLNRLLYSNLLDDRVQREARKFDQFTELIENEYSVNIKTADGYVNVVNPFRASQVLGTPGSGKTYSFLVEAIIQHIQKGFCMVLYDYKFPDLSKLAYNVMQQNLAAYGEKTPIFKVINFDDLSRSHRCNPLQPDLLLDPTDATQAAQALMLGLYPKWQQKQGDFFVESAINFVAASIWALKQIEGGKYCSLPHLIQFTGLDYDELFDILESIDDSYVNNVIAPFLSAHQKGAADQLEGQIATARIALARLTSPTVYYIMAPPKSEAISLQINDPENPTILCLSNNPDRQKVYSPILSLYNTRIMALINKKHQVKTAVILDELPTLSFPPGTLDNLIATARSNKIAVWLGYQDFAQIIRDMGKEIAEAIINTVGNTFTGMVNFDTAKKLSEKFGKLKVKQESVTLNADSTSVQHSVQMVDLIPASEISTLKQGTFVGNVADDFGYEMDQKVFYSPILIDHAYRKTIEDEIPELVDLTKTMGITSNYTVSDALKANFNKIVTDIKELHATVTGGSNNISSEKKEAVKESTPTHDPLESVSRMGKEEDDEDDDPYAPDNISESSEDDSQLEKETPTAVDDQEEQEEQEEVMTVDSSEESEVSAEEENYGFLD